MAQEDRVYLCTACHWEKVPFRRWQAGYFTCLPCGEEQARAVKHCVVPMHKSNYVVVSDRNLLTGVNQKGGLVK
jgi:ribosomal protein L37AE/L43A